MTKKETISLCMIVKNEAEHLQRSIRSAATLFDQLVVVDTGSSDNTLDIARLEGAEVFTFSWCNDFSKARNFAITKATGDWIFMLDGDEILLDGDAGIFKTEIISGGLNAYSIEFMNFIENQAIEKWQPTPEAYKKYAPEQRGFSPSTSIRVYRNNPEITYTGCIHESPKLSLDKLGWNTGLLSRPIMNFGKIRDEQRIAEKYKLYEKLSEDKLNAPDQTRENQLQAVREMATQYIENKNYEAASQFLVKQDKKGLYDAQTLTDTAYVFERLGMFEEAQNYYKKALENFPNYLRANINYGGFLANQKQIQAALSFFKKAHTIDPTNWQVIFNLALCHEELNLLHEALTFAKEAYQINSGNAQIITTFARLSLRNGKYAKCREIIEKSGLETTITNNLTQIALEMEANQKKT